MQYLMNMAIRGIDADFGPYQADRFSVTCIKHSFLLCQSQNFQPEAEPFASGRQGV